MVFHHHHLGVGERALLQEHVLRDGDLAEIVDVPAHPERGDVVVRQVLPIRELDGVFGRQAGVVAGVVVLAVELLAPRPEQPAHALPGVLRPKRDQEVDDRVHLRDAHAGLRDDRTAPAARPHSTIRYRQASRVRAIRTVMSCKQFWRQLHSLAIERGYQRVVQCTGEVV